MTAAVSWDMPSDGVERELAPLEVGIYSAFFEAPDCVNEADFLCRAHSLAIDMIAHDSAAAVVRRLACSGLP